MKSCAKPISTITKHTLKTDNMEVNTAFKEYQERLMIILRFFDKLCRDNGINYTVLDGTLLGAVRHKGMIPWDGDVDVAVTPAELKKLIEVFDKYDGRYYLNCVPNHYYRSNRRRHDFPTLTAKIIDKKCSSGIFGIDVFTIDFLGDDYEFAKKTIALYKRYFKYASLTISFHIPEGPMTLKKFLAIVLYPLLWPLAKVTTPFFERSFIKFREKRIDNNSEDCKYFTIQPYLNRFGIEENTFLKDGYVDMPFGDIQVKVAKNYDAYLVPTYGDYMKLPPEEKRVPYPSMDILTNSIFED